MECLAQILIGDLLRPELAAEPEKAGGSKGSSRAGSRQEENMDGDHEEHEEEEEEEEQGPVIKAIPTFILCGTLQVTSKICKLNEHQHQHQHSLTLSNIRGLYSGQTLLPVQSRQTQETSFAQWNGTR